MDGYDFSEVLLEDNHAGWYRARRKIDGEPVLVKLLDTDPPGRAETVAWQQEHWLLSTLRISGALHSLAVLVSPRFALVCEDFPGEFLKQQDAIARLALPEVLTVAVSLAHTLGDLHAAHVVHKDITPHNVLFDRRTGEVRLTGFGLASRLPRETVDAPRPNSIRGRLPYVSPEQTGWVNRAIDMRSDLYSLGVTLYELLTGVLPFPQQNPIELIHAHIARQPDPPEVHCPKLPEVLSAIVMKLLSKNADDRYQSALGLAADLERCAAHLRSSDKVVSFPLAGQDVPIRFQCPQKLYGRQREIALLEQAFDRIRTGTPEMVLIAGSPGVGKTMVARELQRLLLTHGGSFVSGKFDQLERGTPYSALIQAFSQLIGKLLTGSDDELAFWKTELGAALGSNAQLLVDVIPELALVLGPQPPVPPLSASLAQNRFDHAFCQFFRVFATESHPLVLFLDDLQWVDAASLHAMEMFLGDPSHPHLLLIGAYRENEIPSAHPLLTSLRRLQGVNATVSTLRLPPLPLDAVEQLLCDAFHCQETKVLTLAGLLMRKTGGNPFFLKQFLTELVQQELIGFDAQSRGWRWDLEAIEQRAYTDNVVDLMVTRLKQLPQQTQTILTLAACIGNQFDIDLLALIGEVSATTTTEHLWSAVQAELVLPVQDSTGSSVTPKGERAVPAFGTCRFLHDRVQQAAYTLIPFESREALHLRIGRLIRRGIPAEQLSDHVFVITDQMNLGSSRIDSAAERFALAGLNLQAGRRAKASAAWDTALRYFTHGMALLPPDRWTNDYELSFEITRERAEGEYLVGNSEDAARYIEEALEHASSDLDRGRILLVRLVQHALGGRFREAIVEGQSALTLLGMDMPPPDDETALGRAFEAEMARFRELWGDRPISGLASLPVSDSEKHNLVMEILSTLIDCSINAGSRYLGVVTTKTVVESIRFGRVRVSPFCYVSHGVTIATEFQDYGGASAFGRVGLLLDEQESRDKTISCKLRNMYAGFVSFYDIPLLEGAEILNQGYRDGLESGDLPFAGYCAGNRLRLLVAAGLPLSAALEALEESFAQTLEVRSQPAHDLCTVTGAFLLAMQDRHRPLDSLDYPGLSEAQARRDYAAVPVFAALYDTYRLQAHCFYGKQRGVLDLALADSGALDGMIHGPERRFFSALVLAAAFADGPPDEQARIRARISAHYQYFQVLARHCPCNFKCHERLIAAEMARIDQRNNEALSLYVEAIDAAKGARFGQLEALANETAGRFLLGARQERLAAVFFMEARSRYEAWGASGKVEELDQDFGPHLSGRAWGTMPDQRIAAPVVITDTELSLSAIKSASKAVFSQLTLDELGKTLVRIAIQSGGAQRGLLLQERDGALVVAAEGHAERDDVVTVDAAGDGDSRHFCRSIVNLAKHSMKTVVVADAMTDPAFRDDPYVIGRRSRSIVCAPFSKQGRFIGMLYIENNLVAEAFSRQRLEMLELLAAQATIALDNALLFEEERRAKLHLEAEVVERRRSEMEALRLRELVDDVVDSMPSAIVGVDAEGIVTHWNREAEKLTGLSQADAVGGYLPEALRELGVDQESVLAALDAGTATKHERVPCRIAGKNHVFDTAIYPLSSGKGAVLRIDDVTLRAQLEEQLLQAQKMEAVGKLAGGVAHDFNNLLTGISGYAELILLRLQPDDSNYADVREILEAAQRAAALTGQLLTFSKKHIVRPQAIDMNTAVDQSRRLIQRIIGEDVRIRVEATSDLGLIIADPVQFDQVLINLCTNARDAMPEGGDLTIATRNVVVNVETAPIEAQGTIPTEYVLLEVSDNGFGMSPETLRHALEPFFTTKKTGTGLGLATVQKIVGQYGGVLRIDSVVGRGTRVEVCFPRVRQEAAAAQRQTTRVLIRGSETVLLVEDEDVVRSLAARVLREQGYEVLTAATPKDAQELFDKYIDRISLLVTDVIMPQMSGRRLFEILQQRSLALRVLYMSGYADGIIAEQGVLSPETNFLAKPFNAEALTCKVREALDR